MIESLRRVIRIFQLLHIHIFDKLDRQLALIEGKLLKPIIDMLRRVNTLGNWASFILNDLWRFRRGLLLGSMSANSGGVFNLVVGAPLLAGSTQTAPPAVAPPPAPFTVASFRETVNGALTETAAAVNDPIAELGECWKASFQQSLIEGDPIGELWDCLAASVKVNF